MSKINKAIPPKLKVSYFCSTQFFSIKHYLQLLLYQALHHKLIKFLFYYLFGETRLKQFSDSTRIHIPIEHLRHIRLLPGSEIGILRFFAITPTQIDLVMTRNCLSLTWLTLTLRFVTSDSVIHFWLFLEMHLHFLLFSDQIVPTGLFWRWPWIITLHDGNGSHFQTPFPFPSHKQLRK